MNIYLSIINQELNLNEIKDKDIKSLLTLILKKNPMSRLYKFKQIKIHPFFKLFNWVIYYKTLILIIYYL